MTIFASDLDRTLIYSKRALEDFKEQKDENAIGVERLDNKTISYMSKKSFMMLRELAGKILFIPVTTRTAEQYNRIRIFARDIPVTYAVTSNGANIFYNKKPLKDWENIIHERLKTECASIKEMTEIMQGFKLNARFKSAEALFFYYILEEPISFDQKLVIQKTASEHGWRTSLQGRKLYLMPNPISKGEAVQFIKEREGMSTVIGAGDSLLDSDLLRVSNYSFIPAHGELAKEGKIDFTHVLTSKKGILAAEEILKNVNHLIETDRLASFGSKR